MSRDDGVDVSRGLNGPGGPHVFLLFCLSAAGVLEATAANEGVVVELVTGDPGLLLDKLILHQQTSLFHFLQEVPP